MTVSRKRLSDILDGDKAASLETAWNDAQTADDLKLLPAGEYIARILSGELFTAKRGTPAYKVTLEVAEGEHAGRKLWMDHWLTPAAMPLTKRDLGKLGVTNLAQLERPLPAGILLRVKVTQRRNDDQTEFNSVKSFDFVGIEPGDAFAPDEQPMSEEDLSFDPAQLEKTGTPANEPATEASATPTPPRKGGKKS